MSTPGERLVAGLTCSEVLAVLSDIVDGDLDSPARDRVVAHLRGCDWCERFGGRFQNIVESLRRELRNPEPLESNVATRLREALKKNV